MEDRETARMRKYGESKTTRIMMQLHRTSLPVWDLEKFQADGFCWHECTLYATTVIKHNALYITVLQQPSNMMP